MPLAEGEGSWVCCKSIEAADCTHGCLSGKLCIVDDFAWTVRCIEYKATSIEYFSFSY
jgi:hypothetical protein